MAQHIWSLYIKGKTTTTLNFTTAAAAAATNKVIHYEIASIVRKRIAQNKLITLEMKASIQNTECFFCREKKLKTPHVSVCISASLSFAYFFSFCSNLFQFYFAFVAYCVRIKEFSQIQKCQNHTSALFTSCGEYDNFSICIENRTKFPKLFLSVICIGDVSCSKRIERLHMHTNESEQTGSNSHNCTAWICRRKICCF